MEQISIIKKPSYVPENDSQRLEALHRYHILYTPPEKTFDEIAVLLADTFEVPMAFLSLVDEQTVFFKAKVGPFAAREVKRNNSFCSLSILKKEATVFEDTSQGDIKEIFPDFTLPKGILFYAGTPIVTEDGFAIGTVCIAHNQPRSFSKKEERLLQQFARLAMKELENRKAAIEHTSLLEEKVAESLQKLKQYEAESQAFALYKQAPVAISLYMGEDLIVTFANETALQLSGKTLDVLGKRLIDILPEVESQGYIGLLSNVYKTGKLYQASEAPITLLINGQPKNFYFNFIYQPYYSSLGVIEGVLAFGVDITEQVLARKTIEKSEQKFRNVLSQAPYPILILKGEEMVLEVANPYLFKLWNIDETSLGRPFLQILPEMKEQGFWELLQSVYNEGKVHYGYESPAYFVRNGEKVLHYFNFVYHPYTEKDGSISGVLILATDVTDQVLVRQKAAESEAHFRSMILQAPVGICIIHQNGLQVEIANEKYAKLFGLGRSAVEGHPITDAVPETKIIESAVAQVTNSGKPFYAHEAVMEIEQKGHKKLVYADFVFEPLQESATAINRIMVLAIDVTEKVKARQKIETIEARTRLAVESAELGTFDVDLVTGEVFENRRLREIFDVPDTAGHSAYFNAIHPDDISIKEAAYKKAFQTGILEYEVRVVHRNSSIHWIKLKGTVNFNAEGLPLRIQGVALNITEQKHFAEELARQVAEQTIELTNANRMLVRKNEELDQFVYVASHDLQEPLRKILIFNSIIKERHAVSDEVRYYMDKISAAANRMNGLIKSFLDFSRLSSNAVRYEPVDLNLILANAKEDLELLIEQKEAIIEHDYLPTIEAVPLHIGQLFFNLIGNALKFSRPQVTPVITITSTMLSEGEKREWSSLNSIQPYVKIVFSDNGIGFNQEYASKVFTIFQTLNDRSQYGGYGIGLALCKKIVDNHGGVIKAEGQPEKGATFTVILPQRHA